MEKIDTRTEYGEKKLRSIIKEQIGWMGDMFNDLQEVEDKYVQLWQDDDDGVAYIADINSTMSGWVTRHMSRYLKFQIEDFKKEMEEAISNHHA